MDSFKMDSDFDPEIIRIRKLIDDCLLQAEKENLAILQRSNHEDTSKSKKTCAHVKSPLPSEQTSAFDDNRNLHSRIHFLNSVQNSLLPKFNKERIMNESKNKYTPCAIPLSPPIRLKRDTDESVSLARSTQNNTFIVSPHLHTCGKSSNESSHKNFIPIKVCNKSLREDRPIIEKNFPSIPVHYFKEIDAAEKEHSSQNFPSMPVLHFKENNASEREHNSQVNNEYPNISVISKDQSSPYKNSSFVSSKSKISVPKETKAKQNDLTLRESQAMRSELRSEENSKDYRNEKNGFHLQISLDSSSTKDAVNEILTKIPTIINKFGAISEESNRISCAEVQNEEKEVKYTGNFSKHYKNSEKGNCVASFTQTDENEEDVPLKKCELHDMVKEIVLDTLKSMHICGDLPIMKVPFTKEKIDSGIQTEEESDTPEHIIVNADCTKTFIAKESTVEANNHLSFSKDIQVNINASQNDQLKHIPSTNSKRVSNYSLEMLQDKIIPYSYTEANSVKDTSERNFFPEDEFSIKLMLQKIYEHVCKKDEVQNYCIDNQLINSVYTRDVAVQFNPLHTSTKSTSTNEMKKIDSSCQYDDLINIYSMKSSTDASVQVEICNKIKIEETVKTTDAYTQHKKEDFSNVVTQTDAIADSDIANTSGSATPVSENMFMDDMLSEGEVALPWNLRLLSGGTAVFNKSDCGNIGMKERDYSLSEGEIHPSVVHYLNLCPCSHNDIEDDDTQNDAYPSKVRFVPKIGATTSYTGKDHSTSAYSKKQQVCSSFFSESEYNSNTSLSAGEISPSFFKTPLMSSSHLSESDPSCSANKPAKLCIDNASYFTRSNTKNESSHSDNFSSLEHGAETVQNLDNSTPAALQSLDEDIHDIFK